MVTKNFKNFMASILASRATANGYMPCKDLNGNTRYICDCVDNSAFPRSVNNTFQLTASNAGVSVGTGTTAATDEDYQLEATVTSGLSGNLTYVTALDSAGNRYLQYDIVLTNNTANEITVGEIGYKQAIRSSTVQGGSTNAGNTVMLIDRTVLNAPVTIPAGGSALVRYILKTVLYTE